MEEHVTYVDENAQCCVGCLCSEAEFNLQEFVIRCEPLKAIFQVDKIWFCYLCKRIAQHMELFVQNVQSNQILLGNSHGDLSSIQSACSQVQPCISLAQTALFNIELDGNDDDEEMITFSSKELKIKLELKEEGLDHLEGEFLNGGDDDFQESFVKEEDDFPLNSLLSKEIELENINLKSLSKTMKSKKVKKKAESKIKERIKNKLIEPPKSYTKIRISDTQCKKERKDRAQEKLFLNSPYKCKGCIKGFILQETYDRHMIKHSVSRGKFRCPICTLRYDTSAKLAHHKQGHTLRYKCPECDFTCASCGTIKEHLSKHTFNNGYCELKCPHCPKVFTRAVTLRKHKYYRHSGRDKVECEICHNIYANKESLRAHLMRKHPSSDVSSDAVGKRYECGECGQRFRAPSQLRNHAVKHSEQRAFYCVECDRSFKAAASLAHHLKTAAPHINYSELPLQCQHCDKKFAIKRDLVRHTNRVHLNIKPYACDKCDRSYINSWSLREHKRYTHDGVKRPLRYPCSMCDKVFDRNSILKSHIRTHTGERPYRCVRCPAAFAQASARGTHVRLVHLRLARNGRPKPGTNDI